MNFFLIIFEILTSVGESEKIFTFHPSGALFYDVLLRIKIKVLLGLLIFLLLKVTKHNNDKLFVLLYTCHLLG